MVELRGFEPLTPTLPVWCATSCAIAPLSSLHSFVCNGLNYIWFHFVETNRVLEHGLGGDDGDPILDGLAVIGGHVLAVFDDAG